MSIGARGVRGRTSRGVSACERAFLAWLRCHPCGRAQLVQDQTLPALSVRLYRVAFVFVTACRWTIVSPIIRA